MKRRVLAVLLTMSMIFTVVGCGAKNEQETAGSVATSEGITSTESTENASEVATDASSQSGDYKVAFICKDNSDTFCLGVQNEFKNAVEQYEDLYTVDYFDSQGKAEVQNNQIETCTASGYNAIVFQQVDAEAPISVVKAALDKGIYVIVTTGHIEDDGASWYIDADPYQQGQIIAQYAADNGYLDNAEVAILSGPTGNYHSENRIKAYNDVVGTVDGASVVATEVGGWSKDDAMTITQNWLVANPNLKVILSANDDMAMGAVEAIEMAGKEGEISVFAIDGTDAGIQAVKEGKLCGTVKQDIVSYANNAADFAATLLQGGTEESMKIDSTLITKENVDEYLN